MAGVIRMLLVEDNPYDSELIVDELASAGFELEWERVDRAVDFLARLSPALDLIISDYGLPQFDGLRALRLLLDSGLDIPFILVSGSIGEEQAVGAMQLGAADYVLKDRLARLGQAVVRALENKALRLAKQKADQALVQNERRFRAVIEHSADAILLIDPDGTIKFASPSTADILDAPISEIVGTNRLDYIHPDDVPQVYAIFEQVRQSAGITLRMPVRYRDHLGGWRWIEGSLSNLLDVPGVEAIVANYRDITERKQAEEAELEQRTLAQALSDTAAALNSTLEAGAVLEQILANAGRVVPHDAATIMLLEGQCARVVGSRGYNNPETHLINSLELDMAQTGNLQQMLETGQPVIVTDTQNYPGWNHTPTFHTQRASVGAPLRHKDKTIGFISLDSFTPNRFTPTDAKRLLAFADQAAVALENARLLAETRRRADEFAALYDTSHNLTLEADLDTLLHTILGRATTLLHGTTATLHLFDALAGELTPAVRFNNPDRLSVPRVPLGKGMSGQIALTRRSLIVNDYAHWELRNPEIEDNSFRAGVGAPLIYQGEFMGTLVIGELAPSTRTFSPEDAHLLELFAVQAAGAIHDAQLLQETQSRAAELSFLYDTGLFLNSVGEPRAQLEYLARKATDALHAERAEFFRYVPESDLLQFEFGVGHGPQTEAMLRAMEIQVSDETHLVGWVGKHRMPLNLGEVSGDARWHQGVDSPVASALWVPVEHEGVMRGVLGVLSQTPHAFSAQDERLLSMFANQAAISLENTRLLQETQQRLGELEAINRISSALRTVQRLDELVPLLLDEMLALVKTNTGSLWLYKRATDEMELAAGRRWTDGTPTLFKRGQGIPGLVLATGQSYFSRDFKVDGNTFEGVRGLIPPAQGGACIPIRADNQVVGLFFVIVELPRVLSKTEVNLLETVAEIAGNSIHRMRLFEETSQRLAQLTSLRVIDQAIGSSLDLRVTLNVVLDQVVARMGVDAASVLLWNPATLRLETGATRGFRSDTIQKTVRQLGEGLAGGAALERKAVNVPDIAGIACSPDTAAFFAEEGFGAYYGVPLMTKGQVLGVLELFQRAPRVASPEWMDFVDVLAKQAAIALDNASLLEHLTQSNVQLQLAYDATIEGWSRALDLRDKETEGHTQRVMELTLRLARVMGIDRAELVQIRRGALLHDIGKMGVPDSILFKPGPLTDAEWEIMRMHPVHAFMMLSPIAYLRPALDIPYCHHEKWDGTGYPRKLKGEQIPLGARIFAVVDVWDALTSDRPYRKAWSPEKTREYIAALAGIQFDPQVVPVFLDMLDKVRH